MPFLPAAAQPDWDAWWLEEPAFIRFTMEQGLADNWVHAALRDSYGFLWFGTEGGLSRFDGKHFQNYYEKNEATASGLSKNSVKDICESPDGALWLATLDGGLNRFDPASGTFEHWQSDTSLTQQFGEFLSLTSICQDGDLLWLGSYHHGLGCFNKKARRYEGWYNLREDSLMANTFQFNSVNDILLDRHNPRYLWAAVSGRGLARFDKSTRTFEIIELKDRAGNAGPSGMSLLQAADGKIWVAAWSLGLVSYDPVSRRIQTFPYDLASWQNGDHQRNVVLDIAERGQDGFWVATQDQGFGIFDKHTGQYQFLNNARNGESPELDRHCEGLYLDEGQRLWVLGIQGGVRAFDLAHQSVRYISLAPTHGRAERAEVTAFAYVPQSETVFIATEYSGCYEWSYLKNSMAQRAKPLTGGTFQGLRTLLCDSKGNVWAGAKKTMSGGATLYFLEAGSRQGGFFKPAALQFTQPSRKNKMPEETINDIFEDSKGYIWVATSYDGVYKIAPKSLRAWHFSTSNPSLPNTAAFKTWWVFLKIGEDENGHLWFALKSGGVMQFDPVSGQFRMHDNYSGLPYDNTRAMAIGKDGRVWVGTNNNGVQVFRPGQQGLSSIRIFMQKDGLPGSYISNIAEDEAGNVWLATDNGLAVYRAASGRFETISRSEGIRHPFLKDKGLTVVQGLGVLVGQPNGFCVLNTRQGKPTGQPGLKVALTDFRVFYRSRYFEKNIRSAKEIVLKPSENVFAFEFGVPAVLNPELVTYQFQLEGFDENGYTVTGQSSVTYTGLAPGSYTFRVNARQPDGRSGEVSVGLLILPHWWQTWWFWAAMAAIGFTAVWAFIRYRTSQVRHEEQMKTGFYKQLAEKEMTALRSQMNPHFIFNCLNSINNFIMRNDNSQATAYVAKFSRLIRLVLDNSVSPKVPLEKDLEALRLYMDLEAMRFGEKFRYEIWVGDEVDEQFILIPPLLVQPYVENAIWHGLMHKPEGGSVVVDIRQPSEYQLVVEITDDGVGRSRAAALESKSSLQHKSHGMRITTDRMRMLDTNNPEEAKVTVHDLVDTEGLPCGTKAVLEIPI